MFFEGFLGIPFKLVLFLFLLALDMLLLISLLYKLCKQMTFACL